MNIRFIVAVAAICCLSRVPLDAATILDEHFTDGDSGFGSDANDGNFLRQNGISQTIGITVDGVIGGGNALSYNNQTNGTLVVGQMPSAAILGANVGDRIDFSFDFRMTQLPTPPNSSLFRFGLFNHSGTAATDGGTETNSDSGYFDNFGAGGSVGDAGWAKESGGGDGLLGGGGAASIPGGTTIQAVDINDSLSHHVLAQITRTATGVSLNTYFDSVHVDSSGDNTSPLTSFNEVGFRLIAAASANYDNILVQTVAVPEPSTLVLASCGILLVLRQCVRSRPTEKGSTG